MRRNGCEPAPRCGRCPYWIDAVNDEMQTRRTNATDPNAISIHCPRFSYLDGERGSYTSTNYPNGLEPCPDPPLIENKSYI